MNLSSLARYFGPNNSIAPLDVNESTAFCPAGQKAVSGGGIVITPPADGIAISGANAERTAWIVVAGNNSDTTSGEIQAIVYCAGAGQAVAASTRARMKTRTAAEASRLVSRLKAVRAK